MDSEEFIGKELERENVIFTKMLHGEEKQTMTKIGHWLI